MKIAITGANGHLGQRLIGELCQQHEVLALVRSEHAVQAILARYPASVSCVVVDYTDAGSLADAIGDAEALVHLVGIIKESATNTFYQAHEATSQALVEMFEVPIPADQDKTGTRTITGHAHLRHIVYLSLLGVDKQSDNSCFSSRAMAEDILKRAPVNVSIIRVPMVLGEGDFASASLAKRVIKKYCFVLRGASLEQPIYAGDVIRALVNRLEMSVQLGEKPGVPESETPGESVDLQPALTTKTTIELAGPESLTRTQLTKRAAAKLGFNPTVISVPQFLIVMLAWVFEKCSKNPPVTRAMLGVLDHDDNIDVKPALAQLGISLTSLDQTLACVLANNILSPSDK